MMGLRDVLGSIRRWPLFEQARRFDATGLGSTAFSKRSIELTPRTRGADAVVKSICPY